MCIILQKLSHKRKYRIILPKSMLHYFLCILIVRIKSEPVVSLRHRGNTLTTRHTHYPWPMKMKEVT
jgi:hypothetical protein